MTGRKVVLEPVQDVVPLKYASKTLDIPLSKIGLYVYYNPLPELHHDQVPTQIFHCWISSATDILFDSFNRIDWN